MRHVRLLTLTFTALAILTSGCSSGSNKSEAGDPGHPTDGEVFLEPFHDVSALAFTKSVALAAVPNVAATKTANGSGVQSVRGSDSSLYAGSGSQPACDATALATFLANNTGHAQTWVDGLNADPALEWSGGAKLSVDDIPTYLTELTSVFLQRDTRATNYGVRGGRAVPRQSVLQRGTAVFVDTHGVPRIRCATGSPLTAAKPAPSPRYRGVRWAGFDASRLVLVEPAARTLTTLHIVDIHTREVVEISLGSGCLCDRTLETTTTTSTTFFDENTTSSTAKKSVTTTSTKRPTTTSVATTIAPATTQPTTAPTSTTTEPAANP